MMPDIRPIDANSLCRKINESIKVALEWENEAQEINDTYGVKCAIDTRRSLLSMLLRVSEEPTIDAQPVKLGKWILVVERVMTNKYACSECDSVYAIPRELAPEGFYCYCPRCGADMRGEVDDKP